MSSDTLDSFAQLELQDSFQVRFSSSIKCKEMKKLVETVIMVMPDFVNVGIFLLFVNLIFAIFGIHSFSGVLYNRCRLSEMPDPQTSLWPIDHNITQSCSKTGNGLVTCPSGTYCGNPSEFGISLEADGVLTNKEIWFGIVNFDNIASAMKAVFIILSTDNWNSHMTHLMNVESPILAGFYCIFIVMVGTYFLLNLILAVIISSFIKIEQVEIEEEIKNAKEFVHEIDSDRPPQKQGRQKLVQRKYSKTQKKNSKPQSEQIAEIEPPNLDNDLSSSRLNEINDQRPCLDSRIIGLNFNVGFQRKNRLSCEVKNEKKISELDIKKAMLSELESSHQDTSQAFSCLKPLVMKQRISNLLRGIQSASKIVDQERSEEEKQQESKMRVSQREITQEIVQSQPKERQEELPAKESRSKVLMKSYQDNQIIRDKKAQILSHSLKLSPRIEKNISQKKVSKSYNGKTKEQKNNQAQEFGNMAMRKAMLAFIERKAREIIAEENKYSVVPNELHNALLGLFDNKRQQFEIQFNQLLKVTKQGLQENAGHQGATNLRELSKLKVGIKRQKEALSKLTLKHKKATFQKLRNMNKCYKFAFMITKSPFFYKFFSILILANGGLIAMDRYPSLDNQNVIENIQSVFSYFFVGEMIVMLFALGIKPYFRDAFNVFDCILVVLSIINLIIDNFTSSSIKGLINAFRSMRMLRIFKLAKEWKSFKRLLMTIIRTMKDISIFSLVLLLVMFSFSLVTMEMFSGKLKLDSKSQIDLLNGTSPPANFDTFLSAFTTNFIYLTNDSVGYLYFNLYRIEPVASTIYLLAFFFISQKIMLNLFLAILLQNFDQESLNQDTKQKNKKLTKISNWKQLASRIKKRCCLKKTKIESVPDFAVLQEKSKSNKMLNSISQTLKNQIEDVYPVQGKSLFFFSRENKFRLLMFKIQSHKLFESFILLIILFSTITLALDNPNLDPEGSMFLALQIANLFTTSLFLAEAAVKIVANGFLFCGDKSYLKNFWNILDFAVVILSILADSPLPSSMRIFKIIRIGRPLRLIGQNENLKLAVKALAQAVPSMINVTIVMLLFFIIFGMVCVNFFKGKFYYCNITGIKMEEMEEVTGKWDCLNAGGTWLVKQNNFDNLFQAILVLFYSATTSGWSDIMFQSIETKEIDEVMDLKEHNQYWAIFFIVFMILCSFFLVNLFVGVVISNFNRQKEHIGGNNLLTSKQKEWIDTNLLVIQSKPIKKIQMPENKIRLLCFKIQENKWFERFILLIILFNMVILMMKHYDQSEQFSNTLEIMNYMCAAIFSIEAFIKIIACFKNYFRSGWNIFDFFVVVGSIVSIILTNVTSINLKEAKNVLSIFRTLRIMRLVQRAKSLKIMFKTILVSLTALANVGCFLCLLLYIYSVLGMFLFGQVKRNGYLDDVINFETFPNAFVTLFTAVSAETFNPVYLASIRTYDIDFQCINNPSFEDYQANGYQTVGCGSGRFGLIFFFSFILFVKLIFLNLFIAIILEGYDDTQTKDERMFNSECLNKFREEWSNFDPDASGFILISDLKRFLFQLGKPLGWDDSYINNLQAQDKFLLSLDLPVYNDFKNFQYLDVLESLSLKMMVKDQIIRNQNEKLQLSSQSVSESQRNLRVQSQDSEEIEQEEKKIKKQIENDIYSLKLKDQFQNVSDYKKVIEKEVDIQRNRQKFKKDSFTIAHVTAASAAVQQMKYIQQKRKLEREILEIQETQNKDESSNVLKIIEESKDELVQQDTHKFPKFYKKSDKISYKSLFYNVEEESKAKSVSNSSVFSSNQISIKSPYKKNTQVKQHQVEVSSEYTSREDSIRQDLILATNMLKIVHSSTHDMRSNASDMPEQRSPIPQKELSIPNEEEAIESLSLNEEAAEIVQNNLLHIQEHTEQDQIEERTLKQNLFLPEA